MQSETKFEVEVVWNGITGAGEQHWYTYNQYDSDGHLLLSANPSAVEGYDENEADLGVTLRTNAGLIEVYEYYTATTAPEYNETTPPTSGGGVDGYQYRSGVKQGTEGAVAWKNAINYVSKTVNGHKSYYAYQSISYADASSTTTDTQTTTYRYTFFSADDTSAPVIHSVETVLQAVDVNENGSGDPTSSFTVYDLMGRTVWTRDAGGYLGYTEYDPVTGSVTKQIEDADLGVTGAFTEANLDLLDDFTSWTTPADAGQHRITSLYYDDLGRVTKQVAPDGTISYTVYNDADQETRTYQGWNETTHQPTGPISVSRTDLAGNYTESLTFTWNDVNGLEDYLNVDGSPNGTEPLTDSRATIQSLSRSLMNQVGQATQSRDYFSFAGMTYSTARELGTEGVNYLETVSTYDPLGRHAVTESPDGTVRHTFYDTLNRVTEEWVGTDDVPDNLGTQDYNNDGVLDLRDFRAWVAANPTATSISDGTMTMYQVSATIYDNGLSGGDSLVTESRTYYDITTSNYYATSYHYDYQGRTTDTLSPGDLVTHYEYDNQGRTLETLTYADTDHDYFTTGVDSTELRAMSETSYDSLGRAYETRTYEINPTTGAVGSSLATGTWYNERGMVDHTTNELGQATTYEYDSLGRQTKVTQPDPDGTGGQDAPWTEYVYDDAGNLYSMTDRLGNGTTYLYDAIGRVTHETDANNDTTIYTYDDAGNLESLTDPELNETSWVYDKLGRVIHETNSLGQNTSEYDSGGHLWRETDRNGQVIEYTYDFQGNCTAELWKDGTTTVHEFTFTYDLLGRMLTASDASGSFVYTYDNAGRLYTETQTLDGLTPTVVLTYEYNDRGLLAHTTATMGGVVDSVTDYFYNGFGRLESVQQHGVTGGNAVAEKRVDYTYDDAGQWDLITRYANLAGTELVCTADYGYDFAGRLTSLVYTQGLTTLVEYGWAFDEGNNMTQYVNSIDGTVEYDCDAAGQLTDADYDYQDDENYVYDENGNRITANGDTYVTGQSNRLLSDGTYRYDYDDAGNRTLKFVDTDSSGTLTSGDTDITEYAWDYRNRLTTVATYDDYTDYVSEEPNQVVDYVYDYQNRLVAKILDSDGDGDTDASTVYVHAGDQIIAQFDKSGTGDAAASDLSHRYLWATAIDQLMADETVTSLNQTTPADDLWPLIDHLGTVRDLAEYDSGQDETTIVNHRVFDAFGNMTDETDDTIDCVFSFTGRLFDEDTNLQNNLNRWYDPAVGRWISQDPIGFDAGDANLYRYVANNPVFYIDPTGHAPVIDVEPEPLPVLGRPLEWWFDPRRENEVIYHTLAIVEAGFAKIWQQANEMGLLYQPSALSILGIGVALD